ncbi:MAG: hypothetical protein AAB889_03990 [Patescibacteria group bacterium]
MVAIENTTGAAVDEAIISIQSSPIDVAINRTERNIPPYSSIQIPVSMTVPNAWTRSNGRITAQVNAAMAQAFFVIQPFYGLLIPVAVALLVLLLFAWIIFKKS